MIIIGIFDFFLISLQIYSPSALGKLISNNNNSGLIFKISFNVLLNVFKVSDKYPLLFKNISNSFLNFSSS
mgnify:CR=1 FL=1